MGPHGKLHDEIRKTQPKGPESTFTAEVLQTHAVAARADCGAYSTNYELFK